MGKRNIYLNYGLLGLASIIKNKCDPDVKMIQGDYKSIESVLSEINILGINLSQLKTPIFISIPSFLSFMWGKLLITELNKINPNLKIVVGGRWVIDNNIDWVKKQLPTVNLFVKGFGESVICDIFNKNIWRVGEVIDGTRDKVFEEFDYTVLNNYMDYQPSLEISSGCGMGCEFCVENKNAEIKNKSPKDVIEEAKLICKMYKTSEINIYFEASIFNPTMKWANEFKELYDREKMKFKWRFETRVDIINPKVIEVLAMAGLKVVDLGLESACESQLLNMKKTNDPEKYLKKAKELLKVIYENNVWAKINLLLYLDETSETIAESEKWLDRNSKFIKGVSINPLILYLNGSYSDSYINDIEKITKIKVDLEKINKMGYTFIDLSQEIKLSDAIEISHKLSNKYMSEKDRLELKEICYFKRTQ